MNRARLSAAAYPPKYRELLMVGALKQVTIPCVDYASGIKLRHQISMYRKAAKAEKLPDCDMMYKAVLREPKNVGVAPAERWVLVIEPRGAEFDEALSGATFQDPSPKGGGATPTKPGLLDDFDPEAYDDFGQKIK